MTIKDLMNTVDESVEVRIGWEGYILQVDLTNPLTAQAFGDYVIAKLMPTFDGKGIEATLKAEPVKEK